jgi:hypothetical protein
VVEADSTLEEGVGSFDLEGYFKGQHFNFSRLNLFSGSFKHYYRECKIQATALHTHPYAIFLYSSAINPF